MPIKYVVDSVSSADTQQSGYNLLESGGTLAVFLPIVAQTTDDKGAIYVLGIAAFPANTKLLETLYHDNLEGLLKEGAIKVYKKNTYSSSFHC